MITIYGRFARESYLIDDVVSHRRGDAGCPAPQQRAMMQTTGTAVAVDRGWTMGIDFGTDQISAVLIAPDGRALPLLPAGDVAPGKPSAAMPGRPPFRVPATFALVSAGGRCATPDEPRDEDETPVRLRTCSTDPAQRWRSADLGGGSYVLVNVGTGKCLDLNTAPGTGGGLVQQWLCRDNDRQKWWISPAADGLVTLQVRITAECLAVPVGPDGPSDTVQKDACRPSSSW
ncbi:RICIN domain-containing protein [Micromonospora sp. NPDC051300]|uniref:RICIN domain-containing protein n=1 Tax=Micromonospora sp. NPDC051300 TaxID=3364286 RepID=UPI0037ADAFB5